MKATLFGLLLFLCSSSVFSQTTMQPLKTFVIFGVGSEHTYELKQLETLFRNNTDFEMVRFEYARNIAFIVSKEGVEIDENSLLNLSGDLYQFIECKQFGDLRTDPVKFEELYECISNSN